MWCPSFFTAHNIPTKCFQQILYYPSSQVAWVTRQWGGLRMKFASYWPGTISSVTAAPPSTCLFSNTATLLPALARYAAYGKRNHSIIDGCMQFMWNCKQRVECCNSQQPVHCVPLQPPLHRRFAHARWTSAFLLVTTSLVPIPRPIRVWVWERDNHTLPVFFRILLCYVFWCAAIEIIFTLLTSTVQYEETSTCVSEYLLTQLSFCWEDSSIMDRGMLTPPYLTFILPGVCLWRLRMRQRRHASCRRLSACWGWDKTRTRRKSKRPTLAWSKSITLTPSRLMQMPRCSPRYESLWAHLNSK